jgi:hypothetical protein
MEKSQKNPHLSPRARINKKTNKNPRQKHQKRKKSLKTKILKKVKNLRKEISLKKGKMTNLRSLPSFLPHLLLRKLDFNEATVFTTSLHLFITAKLASS